MATLAVAQWAVALSYSDIPDSVRNASKRSLYNWLGCAVGGSNHPTVQRAYRGTRSFFGGDQDVSLYGKRGADGRADVLHGALLNGIASHVHDFDDTHLATIIHPTGPVASAALAYAEARSRAGGASTPVSGRDILLAVTAGIEVSCKLGLAVWPEHYDVGWHITSTTGGIGAAVAVGKLKGLDAGKMAHAVGLASVSVTGLREMFGSDTKSFHVGEAASVGLRAASLAEQGFTSSTQALEAKRGWANVVGAGGTSKLDVYVGELGKVWEIERNSFKPFPCGIVCHPAIDGAIQIHEEMLEKGLNSDNIVKVHAGVHPLVIELTSKRKPKDGLEGKFSVFHGCAVGLVFGRAHPPEYADEVVQDPKIVTVRDKVEATVYKELMADEAHLEVEFSGDQKIGKHVKHALGSLEKPMTDVQLKAKFIAQCQSVFKNETEAISSAVWEIAEMSNVVTLMDRLRGTSSI